MDSGDTLIEKTNQDGNAKFFVPIEKVFEVSTKHKVIKRFEIPDDGYEAISLSFKYRGQSSKAIEKEEKENNAPDLKELGISIQEQKSSLEDFTTEHQGFLDVIERKNLKDSEIVPINVKEINKAIRAFVGSNFANVEYTRNIIWDSYTSFISPFDKFHYHNFIAQVKVKDVKRLKYLEVFYNPLNEKVSSDFVWIETDEEFFRVKENKE